MRPASLVAICVLACMAGSGPARAADDEDTAAPKTPAFPNTYLDLRTSYSTVPANTLSIGFGGLVPLTSLRALAASLSAVGARSSQSVAIDLPLTMDLTDRFSVFAGISTNATRTEGASWTAMTVDSWTVGFQAEMIEQDGAIPSLTVLSTLTRSVGDNPLATTVSATVGEFGYGFDEDQTRGVLAGLQYTAVAVDLAVARVEPTIAGYVGGYYQWPSNWKLTGRAGLQSFGGAGLGEDFMRFPGFTQPMLRFDLDRMDDNDNRLFGVTATIAWTPKPAFQLVLRTPLYAIRN